VILHKDSHTDHVSPEVVEYVLKLYSGHAGENEGKILVDTIELPESMTVECDLYGPIMGDNPIREEEVFYAKRTGREWVSRLVPCVPRMTRTLTVVAGPYDGNPCVLYTCYGGPPAPKETNDPYLKDSEREASVKFWSEHALS
jgi:hypothetical protein